MEIWQRFYEKEQKEKINSKYDRAIESLGRKNADSVHDIFTKKHYLVRMVCV